MTGLLPNPMIRVASGNRGQLPVGPPAAHGRESSLRGGANTWIQRLYEGEDGRAGRFHFENSDDFDGRSERSAAQLWQDTHKVRHRAQPEATERADLFIQVSPGRPQPLGLHRYSIDKVILVHLNPRTVSI